MTRMPVSLRVAGVLVLAACAPSPRTRTAASPEGETQTINQGQALQLITGTLDRKGVSHARGWKVNIGEEAPLNVDLHLADTRFGIEWVSPQDRAERGDALPHPDPDGQLQIKPGTKKDARMQVLILDFTTYRYSPDPELVHHGTMDFRTARSRLQRDVVDFLIYMRDQGAL